MSQVNFADDIRRTKSGKLKKAQVIPKVKFTEPTQKKEYYLTIHNKIKVEYRNREYKNVYEKLLKLDKPEPAYLSLYYEDLGCSINKMLREYIVHKDLNFTSNAQACLHQGKDNIMKLYKLFILNEEVTNERKSINQQMQNSITRFLNIIISFTLKYALICTMQNKNFQAKILYDSLYCICSNILTSSTSNYKILRKLGQGLLVYSVYLIDNKEIDQAISVLFQCLKNQMNLVIILSYRLKEKSRSETKRRKLELFNRLYAIFFNLTHCFQIKQQLHWCYLCLRECQILAELKVKLLEKDIKINWTDTLKNYKALYDEYIELKKIVQVYFDARELKEQIRIAKKYEQNQVNSHEQAFKDLISINSFQKSNKNNVEKRQKRSLRRSVSLQQNLQIENNRRYYKDFGQQILFYGFNLFDKPDNKAKKVHTSMFKLRSTVGLSHNQIQKDPLRDHQLNNKIPSKLDSKLKKKYKKVENNLFRKVQVPMQYDQLQTKFKKMWAQQERENNRCKEKRYLLKYKSQYINYKQIAEQNKSIYQEIQVVKNKNEITIKQKKKTPEMEEEEKDKGIDLFKKIILKHSKQLDIKKSETFNVLKKKRSNTCQFESYTSPDVSVNFLLERVKKEKERAEENKTKTKQDEVEFTEKMRYKNGNCSNVFLTKDTVEIPNLFLSYITSSGFSVETPSSLLEYGHKYLKPT